MKKGTILTGALLSWALVSMGPLCQRTRAAAEDPTLARMLRMERRVTAQAERTDPAYARVAAQLHAVKTELMEAVEDARRSDAAIPAPILLDPVVQELQKHANELQEQLVQTEGYRRLLQKEVRQFRKIFDRERKAQPASSLAIPLYTFQAVRDTQLSKTTYPDSVLNNLIELGLGWIKAAAKTANGGTYAFDYIVQLKTRESDLTGCSSDEVTIPLATSNGWHHVYFRYNESKFNGWGTCNGYALVDLNPSWSISCGRLWYPDWADAVATQHEIGHVLGMSHATCEWTDPYKYNDNEGAASSGTCTAEYDTCNKETIDDTAGCNMEYYDAYFWETKVPCTNDAKHVVEFAKKYPTSL